MVNDKWSAVDGGDCWVDGVVVSLLLLSLLSLLWSTLCCCYGRGRCRGRGLRCWCLVVWLVVMLVAVVELLLLVLVAVVSAVGPSLSVLLFACGWCGGRRDWCVPCCGLVEG